jgi:menaquinone-9 beta-reductase
VSPEPESDVVVVGAGPAGSIAALVLARAGARVRMFDRARFPRDKLCGDTVNPGAMEILARLGLTSITAGALPVDGMIVTDGSGVRCQGRYANGRQGRALRRAALDAGLLGAAIKAGVQFDEGVLVREPWVDGDAVKGVSIAGRNGESRRIPARLVIAADGSSSRIARALSIACHPKHPRRWAVGAYFEGVANEVGEATFGEMHVRNGRYLGIAPMPGGITNACVVTGDRAALKNPRTLLCESFRTDATVCDRFERATMVSTPVCLGPLAVESSMSGVPGLLLAGDAAGFIDPMTGDGLRFAFRGAELAASMALAALQHGNPDVHVALESARRREFATKWRFNRILRALVGSPRSLQLGSVGAKWSAALLEHVIQYAGDARG